MTDASTQKELEELKRQVAALGEARRARPEASRADAPEAEAPAEVVLEDAPAEEHGLVDQVEELVGLLGDELRDNPLAAGVAIFVAGVVVGRLLR